MITCLKKNNKLSINKLNSFEVLDLSDLEWNPFLAGDRTESTQYADEFLFRFQARITVGGQLLTWANDVRFNFQM